MSASNLLDLSAVIAMAGLVFVFLGWFIIVLTKVMRAGVFNLQKNEPIVKVSYVCIFIGGFSLAVSIIGISLAFIWWVIT